MARNVPKPGRIWFESCPEHRVSERCLAIYTKHRKMDLVERVDRCQSKGLVPNAILTITAGAVPNQHTGRAFWCGFLEARLTRSVLDLWGRRVRRLWDSGLPRRYVELSALPEPAVG